MQGCSPWHAGVLLKLLPKQSCLQALEESGNTGLAAEARAKLVHLQTGEPADSNSE